MDGYFRFLIGSVRVSVVLIVAFLIIHSICTVADHFLALGWGLQLSDLRYSAGLLVFVVALSWIATSWLRFVRRSSADRASRN